MAKTKKLLYLLQLEEYQNSRYWRWLRKHPLSRLKEKKGKLKITPRIAFIFFFYFPLSFFLKKEVAIAQANQITNKLISPIRRLIIALAKAKLSLYPHLKKIIITGSYGKTTFKEKLAWVLQSRYQVTKTPGNINTILGVAWFILTRLPLHTQIFIIEAGAYGQGEIKAIAQMIKPQWSVITIFGWMHLERFRSFANIKKTKKEIIPFIKNKAHLFLPHKDHQFISFNRTITTIAQQMKIPLPTIKKRLATFKAPSHRLQIQKIGSLTILDDSYNANPLGARRALKKLATFKNHQKIIVTPGMIELGNMQFKLNYQLGKEAAQKADILVIVGQENRRALKRGAQSAPKSPRLLYLKNGEDWQKKINPYLRPPTAILLENDLPDHYF